VVKAFSVWPSAIVSVRLPELKVPLEPRIVAALLPPDTVERDTDDVAVAPFRPVIVIAVLFDSGKFRLVTSVTISVLEPPARGCVCPMLAVVNRISQQSPIEVLPAEDQ
jgi:hypothetical protein